MSLSAIAIGLLWLVIGIVIVSLAIYLLMWAIESFIMPIPERVKQGVWVILLCLVLIAVITTLVTGKVPLQGRIGEMGAIHAYV